MKQAGPPTAAGLSSNQPIDQKSFIKDTTGAAITHGLTAKGFFPSTNAAFVNRGNTVGMTTENYRNEMTQPQMSDESRLVEDIIRVSIKKSGLDEYMQNITKYFAQDPMRGHVLCVNKLLTYMKDIESLPTNELEKAVSIFVHAFSQIRQFPNYDDFLQNLIANIPLAPNFAGEVFVRISRCAPGQFHPNVIPILTNHPNFSRLNPGVQEIILTPDDGHLMESRRMRNVESRGGYSGSGAVGPMMTATNTQGGQRGNSMPQLAYSSSQMMMSGGVPMNDSTGHYHPSNMTTIPSRNNVTTGGGGGNQGYTTMSGVRMTPQCLTLSLYQAAQSANQMARQARDVTKPSVEIQSSVAFIFNNVCRNNIDAKARELIDLVPPDSIGWLIKNIILCRVTSDQNFHELFLYIIDAINERYNYAHAKATQEIFKIIRHILNRINHSEDDFNNRTILKYLANFLGLLTLAKNRPILCDELNFKALLCEAYYSGTIEMNFVVPFVSRCLEHIKSSMVFKPPNPWTMSHLRVLKELHADDSDYVTSSARFEVEILFSGLALDIKEIEPSTYLRTRENFDKLDQRLIGVHFTQSVNKSMQQPQQISSSHHLTGQPTTMQSIVGGDMSTDSTNAAALMQQQQSVAMSVATHPNIHTSLSQPLLQMTQQTNVSTVSSSKGGPTMQQPGQGHMTMAHQQSGGPHSGVVPGMPPSGMPGLVTHYSSGHHLTSMNEAGQMNQQQMNTSMMPVSSSIASSYVGRYRYSDIKIVNIQSLASCINLDDSFQIFQNHPDVKNQVINAIITAFQQIMAPVLDRCKKHIRPTVKSLVKKDFALDPDPARMQASAQAMTRFLASALALIHSRELLCMRVSTAYKDVVLKSIPTANAAQKEVVERAANSTATTNIDMLVAYMQKCIAERLVREFDNELMEDYMTRLKVKVDKGMYADSQMTTAVNNALPEKLKKSPKGPSGAEMQVYEDFLNSLPGFQPKSYGLDFRQTMYECEMYQAKFFQERNLRGGVVTPGGGGGSAGGPSTLTQGPTTGGAGYRGGIGSVDSSGVSGGGIVSTSMTNPSSSNIVVPSSSTASGQQHTMHPNLYESIFLELEKQLTAISSILRQQEPVKTSLRSLIDAVHLAMTSSHDSSPQEVLQITIKNLMDNYDTRLRSQTKGHEVLERFKEAHLVVIRLMLTAEIPPLNYPWITNQITNTWKNMDDPQDSSLLTGKWNFDPFTELLKIHVISLNQLDQYLAEEIRKNKIRAIGFTLELFEHYIIGEKREFTVLNEYDIYSTIEMVLGLYNKNGQVNLTADESLQKRLMKAAERMREYLDMGLLERYQIPGTSWLYSGCSQSREFDDHPILTEKTEQLMRRWFDIQASSEQRDPKTFHGFLKDMYEYGILENDESITRFFRLATVLVVERALKVLKSEANSNAGPNSRFASYSELDAYARLLALLIKEAGRNNADTLAKPKLLNKALGIISGVLIQEHEVRPQWFNPMPFHRILNMLFMELSDETTMAGLSRNILTAFCNTLHILRPGRTAAFVFSWLEIISQRVFLAKMLGTNNMDEIAYNQPMYAQLIVDLLKYIHTFLNQSHLSTAVMHLYRGTMRWLLVLNRDCPELLSDYHALFCDFIPPTAFQLRNIILSAVPRDSVTVESHINYNIPPQISEISDPSGYCMTAGDRISPAAFKQAIDSFVVSRTPVDFLPDLLEKLRSKPSDPYPYNIEMMSNLLLYLCTTTVRTLREKNLSITKANFSPTSEMVIILSMILNTDSAGRYLLLNVMANQLRYPNSHTYYFMQTFLFLFSEVKEEQIKEQITRVLVERLLVHRPHPWGLLATMSELMRNPAHKFWEHEFTRCATEIEGLLRGVFRNLHTQESS